MSAETPSAGSLYDIARVTAVVATFHAGLSSQSHQWTLRSAAGQVLAQTRRVHRGGRFAQAFWRFWNRIGMGVGDDIHVQLLGANDCVLADATSADKWPSATVVITDSAGGQVIRSSRGKKTLTLFGADDQPIGEIVCEGDGLWPLTDASGTVLGELLAGEPGPSMPGLADWVLLTDYALSTAAYRKGQHLGIGNVLRYTFRARPESTGVAPEQRAALALIPLIAGLTY